MGVYKVELTKGRGFSLDDRGMQDTARFIVVHEDGTVAWRGTNLYASAVEGRSGNGYRLQASKACKNFESYLKRTGKRWELEERERKANDERAQIEKQAKGQARSHLSDKAWAIIELLETNGWENAVQLMTELRTETKRIADEKAEQRRKLRELDAKRK